MELNLNAQSHDLLKLKDRPDIKISSLARLRRDNLAQQWQI